MYCLSEIFKRPAGRAICLAVLILAAAGSAAYADDCFTAIRLDVNTRFPGPGLDGGDSEYYEIDLPSRGLLAIGARAPIDADAEPKLAFFDEACRPVAAAPSGLRLLERYVGGMALRVDAPGAHRFAVASQDPATGLDEYLVTVRFVSDEDLCGGLVAARKTVAETEPDPDLFSACPSKTVAETEPDPDLLKTVAETEPDPDLLRTWTTPLCAADEAGGWECAPALSAGQTVTATLDDARGSDHGVYTFSLATQSTVTVEGSAAAELVGVLYDRHGHRLATSGPGAELQLAKTLAPGRYFVRVGPADLAGGSYALTLTTSGW